MPTTYTNGLKLPDLGSIDWYNAYKNNIDILDPIVGTVNGVATTYAPISHNHDASEITSGTIDIARLPPAALERLTTVADQTARYALTTSTVQLGDTVKQLDTGIMYLVVDTTKLNSADGYVEYSAGTASKAIADEDGTSIKTGYVNVAGNQTVSGQKTWSGNAFYTAGVYHRNNNYEIGYTPASNVVIPIYFTDKVNAQTGYVRNVILATGKTQSELLARNKFTSGALSPTGTDVSSTLQVEVQSNGDKTLYFDGSIRNNVLPYTTNSYSLGSSSYQWSSVYAQTYYYNGAAWGLDKENVWAGNNRFVKNAGLSDVSTYSDNTMAFTANANTIFFNTRGSSNYPSYGTFLFAGYANGSTPDRFGQLKLLRSTDIKGDTYDGYKPDSSFNLWRVAPHYSLMDFMGAVRVQNDGTNNYLAPITTGVTDLGTSTNKWKTLNGINPGALSLPDKDKRIAIDTTGWTYTGSYANQILINGAIQTISGWLYIRIENTTASDYVTIRMNAVAIENPTLIQPGSSATPVISVLFPVVAGVPVYVYTTKAPAKIYLYECLGNV